MREAFVDLVRRYLSREISFEDLEDWEAARFQYFASLPVPGISNTSCMSGDNVYSPVLSLEQGGLGDQVRQKSRRSLHQDRDVVAAPGLTRTEHQH
ncbi:MAG TPA: hypothetical protein VEQ11_09915 [Chloroflexota bacterium]|nr:hypothetical protein [Chloroflexota bacterium]